MRPTTLIVLAAALTTSTVAHARLFWQNYGATVAAPDGGGCAWNLNGDYFVPRTCGAGQYDLYSACKTSYSRSPACKALHPIYRGYCTPYGACHYNWRDHVYKKHCGCTPLKCFHGPWRLEECGKHGRVCGPPGPSRNCSQAGGWDDPGLRNCQAGCRGAAAGACWNSGYGPVGGVLFNVEPIGGETLGMAAAIPITAVGGAGMQPMMGMPPGLPAPAPGPPGAAPGANDSMFTLPSLFGG